MVEKTSQLLKAAKGAVTGSGNKGAMMLAANPKAVTALKAFVKTPAAKILSRAIPGFSAVTLLAGVASLMKKKDKGGMASPGSGRSRTKTGPAMRAKKRAMSDAQKKSGGSTGRDAIRESGRGKAGPKRNVVKGGGGVVRDKRGKAVNFGGANKGGKKSREGR